MTPHDPHELRERIAGRRVVASISGGKDSAAMSLYFRELGIEHDRVFCDTGWEADVTYDYLRGELTEALGPIEEISNPRLTLRKAMFPARTRRFCTQELKVFPMQDYLSARDDEVVNAVGIRHGESKARRRMPEWEFSEGFDCETWRPLVSWTEQDVIDIHTRHELRPNPLYLKGASRVGCWPCIFARKDEIRLIADVDPGRIDLISRLESRVAGAATRRGHKHDNPPTWFQQSLRERRTCDVCEGAVCSWCGGDGEDSGDEHETTPCRLCGGDLCEKCGGKGYTMVRPCVPVDQVVAWSRTSHGGRQIELFAAPESERGCMRWGLCETHVEEGDE